MTFDGDELFSFLLQVLLVAQWTNVVSCLYDRSVIKSFSWTSDFFIHCRFTSLSTQNKNNNLLVKLNV